MDLGFAGEVALVTGGSRGIGLAIARSLLSEGCGVAIAGRSPAALAAAAHNLGAEPGRLTLLEADLREQGAAARLVEATTARHGRLDIVVNGAAGFTEGDVLVSPTGDWQDLFALKLVGYLDVIRAAVPVLREQGAGCVVNIAGIAGLRPIPSSAHVGVVNAGVVNLTRVLARELAGDGIRVNAISPGAVRTDRWEARVDRIAGERGCTRDEAERSLIERLPTGQPVSTEEVAMVATLLCSPRLRSVIGNDIVVDAGMTLR